MYMTPTVTQSPLRQPKMRLSCDGCGAIKGKCDRQLPECARCLARGVTCTYSISRKTGKPRKDRSNNGGNASTSISAGNSSSNGNDDNNDNNNNSSKSNGTSNHNSDIDHEMFNTDFGYSDGMLTTSLNSDIHSSLAFGESMSLDNFDTVTAGINRFETYEGFDLSGCTFNDQRLSNIGGVHHGSSSARGKDHDCHREAQELLGTSLFTNPRFDSDSKTQQNEKVTLSLFRQMELGSAHEATPYFDSRNDGGHEVSFDQVLLLNRKAIERLDSLLDCPCAASPYLMMLYASIISSILSRCQYAASSSNTGSPLVSPSDSVSMARISIGKFRVDDPRVESALNIQLLAGELRAVTGLIDKIASYKCNNNTLVERSGGTNLCRLHQNLAVWLRDEHSRVTDNIRNRLRELNA